MWWLLAMQAVGSVMDAQGKKKEGEQSKKASYYNASVEEQSAINTRTSAALNDYKKRKELEYAIGNQRSEYAAAGVVTNTGSPLNVMVDSMSNAYLDMAIDKYNYEVAARAHESKAQMDRYAGDQAASAGNSSAISSLLKSGSSLYTKTKVGQ